MNIPRSIAALFGVRALKTVDTIIIHHSVADKTLDISQIATMEERDQGFIDVGYHVYTKCIDVQKDLWVCQQGRPIWAIPAAAYGYNTQSYDICIGGNYHPGGASFLDEVSEYALHVVAKQIEQAKTKLPNLKYLAGHRDVATWKAEQGLNPGDYSTACPGNLLYARLGILRQLTGLAVRP
jgi:hypothetical protein